MYLVFMSVLEFCAPQSLLRYVIIDWRFAALLGGEKHIQETDFRYEKVIRKIQHYSNSLEFVVLLGSNRFYLLLSTY